MLSTAPLTDISHVIQLAIAPVFLLTAIATILNVLAGRLGRAVDRRRVLAAALPDLDGDISTLAKQELFYEMRRIKLIYLAISMAVFSALLVAALGASVATSQVPPSVTQKRVIAPPGPNTCSCRLGYGFRPLPPHDAEITDS